MDSILALQSLDVDMPIRAVGLSTTSCLYKSCSTVKTVIAP